MIRLPLRVRARGDDTVLFVNDAGSFFQGSDELLQRLASGETTRNDDAFLLRHGHVAPDEKSLPWLAHLHGVARRTTRASNLDYLRRELINGLSVDAASDSECFWLGGKDGAAAIRTDGWGMGNPVAVAAEQASRCASCG